MDLLNRYLHAVRFWLPSSKQDDILEELSEDIRSQIEEKESALGREMTEAEMGDFLKQRGDPMIVAGQFLPDQHLIGPPWFAIYLFVLRLVLLWVLLPLFVVMSGCVVLFSHDHATAFLDTLGGFWTGALSAFAIITLVFAALDRYHHRLHLREWDPRKLPAVPKPRDPRKIHRANSTVELIWGVLFVLWWVGFLRIPDIPGNTVQIGLAPMWRQFYVPILVLSLSGMAVSLANLVNPWWSRARAAVRLAIDVGILTVSGMMLRGGPWLDVASSSLSVERLDVLRRILDASVSITLTLAAVIALFACVQDIRRLMPAKIPKRSAVRSV